MIFTSVRLMKNKKVFFWDWGLIDYQEAWEKQEALLKATVDIKTQNRTATNQQVTPNHLIFCEHPHVYTLGKSGDIDHLLLDQEALNAQDATFYKINRGGDITYHGPGQLVGYPILDLDNFFTDIHKYLRVLEDAIILTLKEYDIVSGRVEGLTGVWIDGQGTNPRKICAMGVRCSRWVTMHGFALNVNPQLGYFDNIIPCGISDKKVTSLSQELGYSITIDEVKPRLKANIAKVFEIEYC